MCGSAAVACGHDCKRRQRQLRRCDGVTVERKVVVSPFVGALLAQMLKCSHGAGAVFIHTDCWKNVERS